MTDRQIPAQGPPAEGLDLAGFPEDNIVPDQMLYRAHSKPNDAHYRSSSGEGRFDLPAPEGTCYVASSPEPAIREWLGPAGTRGYASLDDCERLQVTVLTGISGRAASVSTADAARFGVTSELTSMTPYTVPQAWAKFLREHGEFDAVLYTPRFTPGLPTALGLFGPGGPGIVGNEVQKIDGADALRDAGITVLPVPSSAALTII